MYRDDTAERPSGWTFEVLLALGLFIFLSVSLGGLLIKGQGSPTALERQEEERASYGPAYTTARASDGCVWRTYFSENTRYVRQRKEIVDDGHGGRANCL